MKYKVYEYVIEFFDKESFWVSQEKGEKLALLLTKQNPPKFVFIRDTMINIASIKRVNRVPQTTLEKRGNKYVEVPLEKEFNEKEESTHQEYLKLKGEKLLLKSK